MDANMDRGLLERPILISGASSGIGYACARHLVQQGAKHLQLTARDPHKLETARQQLTAISGARVDVFVCDHAERDDIDKLLEQLGQHDWPGAFIANVGINPVHRAGARKIHNTPHELCQEILTVNVANTFYLLSALLKDMRKQRFGRIVLMGSQAWRYGIPGQALYNISKSSLVGLKNSVVSEYAANGIFCHLLNPGIVLNERTAMLRKNERLHNGNLKDDLSTATTQGITEDDVAVAAQGLLAIDDHASNGQEINI